MYTLNVTKTKNRAGEYHYQVTDETGQVISERRSNRRYVAATRYGYNYYGRLDLIPKGYDANMIAILKPEDWAILDLPVPEVKLS